jgi:heme a synthase
VSEAAARIGIVRRIGYVALTLAFAQIVFGAIVRITGSGLGCGDHWPRCMGSFFPPLDRPDLIIEVTHRYIAAGLSVAIVALVAAALWTRATPGIGGRGGALGPAMLAALAVVAAALLGAVTVKMGLSGPIVVTHLAIAMSLLALLVVTVARAGGLGAVGAAREHAARRTVRSTTAAVAIAFVVLIFGALTANTPGAPVACLGFPFCTGGMLGNATQQTMHVTHRVLAFLLFFHLLGVMTGVRRRRDGAAIRRAALVAFGAVCLQLVVAAMLVLMHLPRVLQSLHQAVGTLVWLSVVTLAVLARHAAAAAPEAEPVAARATLGVTHATGARA